MKLKQESRDEKNKIGGIKDKATGISQKEERKDKISKIGMKNKKIRGTFKITKTQRQKIGGGSHQKHNCSIFSRTRIHVIPA